MRGGGDEWVWGNEGDERRDFISLTFCEFVLRWLSARDHFSVKLKTLPGGPGPTGSTGPYLWV